MRIRKQYQVIPTNAKLENGHSTSDKNGYTAEYINDHSVVVSAVEPTTDRKKVWKQHSYNLFDGELELGTISSSTGENSTNDNRKRSKNYIEVEPNTTYTLSFNSSATTIVFEYTSNKTFIGIQPSDWTAQPYTFTTSATTKYIRFISYNTSTTEAKIEQGSNVITDKEYILNSNDEYEEFAPQDEIYSTNEVRIGTWIDGKPLYRKVIEKTSGFLTGLNTYNHNIANVNKITNARGIILRSDNYYEVAPIIVPDPYQSRFVIAISDINASTYGLYLGTEFPNQRGIQSLWLILEYTKTTD